MHKARSGWLRFIYTCTPVVLILAVCFSVGLFIGKSDEAGAQAGGYLFDVGDLMNNALTFTGLTPLSDQGGKLLASDSKGGLFMPNPAAVYCTQLGFNYQTVDGDGGAAGICQFPDGASCSDWDFLEGKCGQDKSYCAQKGYDEITKDDGQNGFSQDYAVCVQKPPAGEVNAQGGQEVGSVTDLMNLAGSLNNGVLPSEENPSAQSTGSDQMPLSDLALSSSFDWRNTTYNGVSGNWVTPIKDQKQCGSCWAFSSAAVAESAIRLASNDPTYNIDLAEQYLVSGCSGAGSCTGGYTSVALNYIKNSGIPDEGCLPYVDGSASTCSLDGSSCGSNCAYRTSGACSDKTCSDRCSDYASRLFHLSQVTALSSSAARDTIKNYLVQYGPLSVAIGMGYGTYNSSGVYNCGGDTGTNHAVTVVGYDDASQAWIVKNSWGTAWRGTSNDQPGYFKVGYGQCSIEHYVYSVSAAPPTCPGPALLYPYDKSSVTKETNTFSWSNYSACTHDGYTIQVKDVSNMDSGGTVIYSQHVTGTSQPVTIPPQYQRTGSYLYWGVKADNTPRQASWSVRSFLSSPPVCYNLSLSANPADKGAVPPPGPNAYCASGRYPNGSTVNVTAQPAADYRLQQWSGDASGTTNPLTVVMTRDMSITANFEAIPYGRCEPAKSIDLGGLDVSSNYASGSTDQNSTYPVSITSVPETGPEYTYSFDPNVSGTVQVALNKMKTNLDIIVVADDQSEPGSCKIANAIVAGDTTASFSAQAGSHYYFVVDGANNATGSYYLSVSCADCKDLRDPPDLSQTKMRRPTFTWDPIDNAAWYAIQVATSTTFKSLVLNKTSLQASYTPSSDLPAARTLFWRVAGRFGKNYGPWSAILSFTTPNPPSIPVLASPASKSLVKDYFPTLDWKDSTLPPLTAPTLDHYVLQVATDSGFNNLLDEFKDLSVNESTYKVQSSLAPNTVYYWRVKAVNSIGEYSSWSSARYFRTVILPPTGLTTNPEPVSGNVSAARPVFDWDDVTGASSYSFQASLYSDFHKVFLNKTVKSSTYTPTANLPKGVTIYWRVRANGTNGPSNWVTANSFAAAY